MSAPKKILMHNSPEMQQHIDTIREHLVRMMKQDVSTAEAIRAAVALMAEAIEQDKQQKESDNE